MSKLRIIYYSPHPTHDIVSEVGYSTHQRETINAFRKLGHEVLPVVMGGTEKTNVEQFHDELKGKSSSASLIKRFLPVAVWNALKDIRLLKHDRLAGQKLDQAITEFSPHLIYERGEYLQDSGVNVAAKRGIPHFLEVNSPVVEEMGQFEGPDLLRFLGHLKEKRKLRKTSAVFAISSAMRDYLREKYGCDKPVSVIPNCINPEKDLPEPEAIEKLKHELAGERRIVGFVGSLFPYHGVDVLIRAFADMREKRPDLFLVIVGDGGIRASLEVLAQEILPQDSYLFTGKVPHSEVMKYTGTFDIAVMATSNWYGSPIKIFEYGLMGRIIIAPDNGPVRDAMDPVLDGYLVQPGAAHLAEALETVLNNETEYLERAGHFRKKILTHFTWEHQASSILSKSTPLSP